MGLKRKEVSKNLPREMSEGEIIYYLRRLNSRKNLSEEQKEVIKDVKRILKFLRIRNEEEAIKKIEALVEEMKVKEGGKRPKGQR